MDKINSFFSSSLFKSPSFYSILFIVFVLIWVNFNIRKWRENDTIKSDVISYYAYLPAFIIERSPDLSFTDGKEEFYISNNRYWPQIAPNGKKVIKTTMGMSFLYSPFFFIAHAEAKLKGLPEDGFSQPYHKWIHLSGIFYCAVGLFFLRKILLRNFNEFISSAILLLIVFGTNLFHYTTAEAALSHAPGFALMAIFIYYSILWLENKKNSTSVLLGIAFGLIVLIRPPNIFIGIFPLLYGVTDFSFFRQRIRTLFYEWKPLLLVVFFSFLVFLPQLIYWKYITDSWFFNSYVGERFYFLNSHLLEGFFSYRKGWLIYTPLMIFSVIGFYSLYKKKRDFFFPVIVFFIVNCYVVFSWWCWWYGGGLGMRPMIDSYALMAIPLAVLFQNVMDRNKLYVKIPFYTLLILFSVQNVFQSWQLRNGIIHWDSMTKESYYESLFQLQGNEKIKNGLKSPDYEAAREGKEEYDFTLF